MSKWYLVDDKNGKKSGPFTSSDLRQLARNGKVKPEMIVIDETGTRKALAKNVKNLLPPAGSSSLPPAPTPPPIQHAPQAPPDPFSFTNIQSSFPSSDNTFNGGYPVGNDPTITEETYSFEENQTGITTSIPVPPIATNIQVPLPVPTPTRKSKRISPKKSYKAVRLIIGLIILLACAGFILFTVITDNLRKAKSNSREDFEAALSILEFAESHKMEIINGTFSGYSAEHFKKDIYWPARLQLRPIGPDGTGGRADDGIYSETLILGEYIDHYSTLNYGSMIIEYERLNDTGGQLGLPRKENSLITEFLEDLRKAEIEMEFAEKELSSR